jgi:hypothetical protein
MSEHNLPSRWWKVVELDENDDRTLSINTDNQPIVVRNTVIYDLRAVRSSVHMNRYLDRQARERREMA